MIRVTIDAFSGKPNPMCLLDGAKAKDILRRIQKDPSLATRASTHHDRLGFRGIIVESLSSEPAFGPGLPHRLRIAGGSSSDEPGARALATQIIDLMSSVEPTLTTDKALVKTLKTVANRTARAPSPKPRARKASFSAKAVPGKANIGSIKVEDKTCYGEVTGLAPEFWSTPPVILKNNCYNFASNWANDRFAQPGVGGGCGPSTGTSVETLRAAIMCDGALPFPP